MSFNHWMLLTSFTLASVVAAGGSDGSVLTTDTHKSSCQTFGSGVFRTFYGTVFSLRSTCPVVLTSFTHGQVSSKVTVQRGGAEGLLVRVEIVVNKIRTVLQDGRVLVEDKSVSLPYDHTYLHVFQYGIYTKLRSTVLPLSVTWHNTPAGIDTLWVELEQELDCVFSGLCGSPIAPASVNQLIATSLLPQKTCQTLDTRSIPSTVCREFMSYTLDCLHAQVPMFTQLCEENIYGYEGIKSVGCAFFREVAHLCGEKSFVWLLWRGVTHCAEPSCPGQLLYSELGQAFAPSCSVPAPRTSHQDLTSTCLCPSGKVLNDLSDAHSCIHLSQCTCVFAGRSYAAGDTRSTKCQTCVCHDGRWRCSGNRCPPRCAIQGPYVTTFDGKQYSLPGKCTYVASEAGNWSISVQFSDEAPSLETVTLQYFQEIYRFSQNSVTFGEKQIVELHQSEHVRVYWQSSMYVLVHTSCGLEVQVQVSPEVQLYITPPANHTEGMSGLCGNGNADTTDDFTSSSGIVENSAPPFSLSWSVGDCRLNIPDTCINADNEIFAEEKCAVLSDPKGIFAKCHDHIPTDYYQMACVQRTCSCGGGPHRCLCAALADYANACANQGFPVGDWRRSTNCMVPCENNLVFSYAVEACNATCRSLSGPDPRCGSWGPSGGDSAVEGCGCPQGTHLDHTGRSCTPRGRCPCHHQGGTTPPGPVVIDGRQCLCENGKLSCSEDCDCTHGKVCMHCSQHQVNTAQKTCSSLSKPLGAAPSCQSGCYCPEGQVEDHHGDCVAVDNCTCVYSGTVFSAGQSVKTNCKTCTCGRGQWSCKHKPCPGKCQVFGNGHFQTFDSKWFRFDGHCQYTLVEDDCGRGGGSFSVRVESVPCCDEALTCSRTVLLDLQGNVTLTLSDLGVTRQRHTARASRVAEAEPLYTTHSMGLYLVMSVPSLGLTLIWDKNTRISIELDARWRDRVCGLCGNFDSSEMNDLQITDSTVVSGPLAFGNSWKSSSLPCSDVTEEVFPCERHSYCSAWAQRRCLVIRGDAFRACHLKVDPEPYYQACVLESCSCQFEGKFLGFCTAVAAYAEACSIQDVCVRWRTPDMCPVYCDYYNEQGECRWHYEPCGQIKTCGKNNQYTGKLEGCYPRCPPELPYFDENTAKCSLLGNCTCYFNDTVIPPGMFVETQTGICSCENGRIHCGPDLITIAPRTTAGRTSPPLQTSGITTTPSTPPMHPTTRATPSTTFTTSSTTPSIPTSLTSTTPSTPPIHPTTRATPSTTFTTSTATPSIPTTMTSTTPLKTSPFESEPTQVQVTSASQTPTPTEGIHANTRENMNATLPASTSPLTTKAPTTHSSLEPVTGAEASVTPVEVTTAEQQKMSTSSPTTTTTATTTTATSTTALSHSTEGTSTQPAPTSEQRTASTAASLCRCRDVKRNQSWACGEIWVEDCFTKTCTEGKIQLTPVECPYLQKPTCPRGQIKNVWDGCCETWRCDCRCELYGDPHYISFQGTSFDYLDSCTSILVEEASPRHHLTVAADNERCVPGLQGSCARGVILHYQNHMATLSIAPNNSTVLATLDHVAVQLPHEQHGLRFETTGYAVSIFLPDIRSHVSLSPAFTLVVSLAMEHFLNNTLGQCGVCGVGSCVRRGGHLEEDSCCDQTAHDWVRPDPAKPSCGPRDLPCRPPTTGTPSPTCPGSPLCQLLHHPVFSQCTGYLDLTVMERNCRSDSCGHTEAACSSLEQAASICKQAGECVDWRRFANGTCDVQCPQGMVYRECRDRLDDYCHAGALVPGLELGEQTEGCFCPENQFRVGKHSQVCLSQCPYCKGPLGEPKLPGEVWNSNCHLCTCDSETEMEKCSPKPPGPPPPCGQDSMLVNTSCCGDQVCVEKTCHYGGRTYKVGDTWTDAARPCLTFSCGRDGVETETRVCPAESCPEENRIWDDRHCCFTCNQSCAPRVSSVNITIDDCSTTVNLPMCQGQCATQKSWVVHQSVLKLEQRCGCCRELSWEPLLVTLHCSDASTRTYTHQRITACHCQGCSILH